MSQKNWHIAKSHPWLRNFLVPCIVPFTLHHAHSSGGLSWGVLTMCALVPLLPIDRSLKDMRHFPLKVIVHNKGPRSWDWVAFSILSRTTTETLSVQWLWVFNDFFFSATHHCLDVQGDKWRIAQGSHHYSSKCGLWEGALSLPAEYCPQWRFTMALWAGGESWVVFLHFDCSSWNHMGLCCRSSYKALLSLVVTSGVGSVLSMRH